MIRIKTSPAQSPWFPKQTYVFRDYNFQKDLSPADKELLRLVHQCDDGDGCRLSNAALARTLWCVEGAIRNRATRLKKAGYLHTIGFTEDGRAIRRIFLRWMLKPEDDTIRVTIPGSTAKRKKTDEELEQALVLRPLPVEFTSTTRAHLDEHTHARLDEHTPARSDEHAHDQKSQIRPPCFEQGAAHSYEQGSAHGCEHTDIGYRANKALLYPLGPGREDSQTFLSDPKPSTVVDLDSVPAASPGSPALRAQEPTEAEREDALLAKSTGPGRMAWSQLFAELPGGKAMMAHFKVTEVDEGIARKYVKRLRSHRSQFNGVEVAFVLRNLEYLKEAIYSPPPRPKSLEEFVNCFNVYRDFVYGVFVAQAVQYLRDRKEALTRGKISTPAASLSTFEAFHRAKRIQSVLQVSEDPSFNSDSLLTAAALTLLREGNTSILDHYDLQVRIVVEWLENSGWYGLFPKELETATGLTLEQINEMRGRVRQRIEEKIEDIRIICTAPRLLEAIKDVEYFVFNTVAEFVDSEEPVAVSHS